MQVLQFIFRDFWTWLGTVILLGILCSFRFVDKSTYYDCECCKEDEDET